MWVTFTVVADSAITPLRREIFTESSDPSSILIPIPAFDDQDNRFRVAFQVLQEAIAEHAFPASSLAVTFQNRLVVLKSFGRFTYGKAPGGLPDEAEFRDRVTETSTPFDLASLTKPIATTTMAMILHERGLLDLDSPVVKVVPDFAKDSTGSSDERRTAVTIRMLLAHSSGLPAYEKLFLKEKTRDELLQAAIATPLTAEPGSRAEYSDMGFIILGVALEQLARQSLDAFCQSEIFSPLELQTATFNPAKDKRYEIPPTADERIAIPEQPIDTTGLASSTHDKPRSIFRNRVIQGEVQDENAYVLGGVAGHAGMFASAEDVARFGFVMLRGGAPILRRETVALFTRREVSPIGTTRTMGWDTPSKPSQSGRYFGPSAYGHLGYTGTSLWIDPDKNLTVTLLTNRTWPDCRNQEIKKIRPKVHDAILEALL